MTSITQLIALLQAVVQLLLLVNSTPNVSPSVKTAAISLSQRAIELGRNALTRELVRFPRNATSSVSVVENEFPKYRVNPKPVYDTTSIALTIHRLINQERMKRGLQQLVWNDQLAEVAKNHSEEQAETNRITTNPAKPCVYPMIRHEGIIAAGSFTLAERLSRTDINYRKAAENIAALPLSTNLVYVLPSNVTEITCPNLTPRTVKPELTESEKRILIFSNIVEAEKLVAEIPSVIWVNVEWNSADKIAQMAIERWMDSAGHVRNILSPDFDETGIGIATINDYLIITQVFIKKYIPQVE